MVGLIESLMTAKLVDDITDTHSDKTRESWGQGVANVVTGFFGGMGGCAMIGQTMINVKQSGARTRLSHVPRRACSCSSWSSRSAIVVALIPMAALVAVMILVAVSTFDWHSVAPATLERMPKSETSVMVVTVAVVVVTHNLAYGVGAGVLTAMVLFARRVAHLVEVSSVTSPDGSEVVYTVDGQVFFASSNDLVYQFDYAHDPDRVIIDMSAGARLGRQQRRRAGRHHHQVRAARQDRTDRRHERAQHDDARPPRRPARQPLMSLGTGALQDARAMTHRSQPAASMRSAPGMSAGCRVLPVSLLVAHVLHAVEAPAHRLPRSAARRLAT